MLIWNTCWKFLEQFILDYIVGTIPPCTEKGDEAYYVYYYEDGSIAKPPCEGQGILNTNKRKAAKS